MRRARSVAHVEYEILQWVGDRAWLDGLMEKRFRKGATNISTYLRNMMDRRQHKLPKDHEDYKEKIE